MRLSTLTISLLFGFIFPVFPSHAQQLDASQKHRLLVSSSHIRSFFELKMVEEKEWNELSEQVFMLYHQGRYSEASELAERAVQVAEKTFGPDHPNVAQSLNDLAEIYKAQGRYAEAVPICKRIVAVVARLLGPDHLHMATAILNLATLYRAQGHYADAEPLYCQVLSIHSKALEKDHLDIAKDLNITREQVYSKYSKQPSVEKS